RTAPDWAYGFAELAKGQGKVIAKAQMVSNPGCYPTGAIALLRPLVDAGILPMDYPVTVNAVSGYSGGGKSLIAQMEDQARNDAIKASFFAYGLGLEHKHVKEIFLHSGLKRSPIFTPNVGRFAQGMLVNVPLHLDLLNGSQTAATIHAALVAHYAGQNVVQVVAQDVAAAMVRVDPEALNATNIMKLYVFGDASTGQVNLIAQLDNLGKGASGAAVQNLDLMLGA
ncbi:MAG: N-acetyl-gamma-glutamyl-phosphate reductase, partial [Notoacmeibacter sp.]